jgi:hypothetical protein
MGILTKKYMKLKGTCMGCPNCKILNIEVKIAKHLYSGGVSKALPFFLGILSWTHGWSNLIIILV